MGLHAPSCPKCPELWQPSAVDLGPALPAGLVQGRRGHEHENGGGHRWAERTAAADHEHPALNNCQWMAVQFIHGTSGPLLLQSPLQEEDQIDRAIPALSVMGLRLDPRSEAGPAIAICT